MKKNLSREELIKLLIEEDKIINAEQKEIEKSKEESEKLRVEILRKQKEAEEKIFLANKLEEEKNNNLAQRFASEATIHKSELEQVNIQMEEIDRRLAELTDDSKMRIQKLATQFVDLNKEKNSTLTSLEYKARAEAEDDLKLLDRSFRQSFERNQEIINKQQDKNTVAEENIEVLTRTIDISPLKDLEDVESEEE